MKLSILLLTVPSRVDSTFKSLVDNLMEQSRGKDVEILGLFDNKSMSVGHKRNLLLGMAKGDFFVFIDDDDEVVGNYVDVVLDAIDKNPRADCITYSILLQDTETTRVCYHSKDYATSTNINDLVWYAPPTHTMVWRTDLVRRVLFAPINYGEDAHWIKQACELIHTEVSIPETLYFYNRNYEKSETSVLFENSVVERQSLVREPILSILVATIPERIDQFATLMTELVEQTEELPVEIIGFFDNKLWSVGAKRNALLHAAAGEYVVFIDDDDLVSDGYVFAIVNQLEKDPTIDCLTYAHVCNRADKGYSYVCRYSVSYETHTEYFQGGLWRLKPAHTCTWRRALTAGKYFPEINHGEDTAWVSKLWPLVKNEVQLDEVLYFYMFDPHKSATRTVVPSKKCCGKKNEISFVPIEYVSTMQCSIVMSTFNKSGALNNTLLSIFKQQPSLSFEVIVVDDGSTDDTETVCLDYVEQGCNLKYIKLPFSQYRNPGPARNIGYRKAVGSIIIAQSDEVIHAKADTITKLCMLEKHSFNIGTVFDCTINSMNLQPHPGQRMKLYTGVKDGRPLFFLGSLLREDVYAIGGNDEEFILPGYEDDWFGQCLIRGLALKPVFRDDVLGYHQRHAKKYSPADYASMKQVYQRKLTDARRTGVWRGGEPWPLI